MLPKPMQSCPAVENKIALASNSEWNRWIDEDEGMKFWPMGLYPDIFNYLLFFPLELGSKNLNDYKNSKAYSYHKPAWLQPLLYPYR